MNTTLDNATEEVSGAGLTYKELSEYKFGTSLDQYGHIIVVILAVLGNTAALITITRMKPISTATISVAILAVFDSLAIVAKFVYTKLTYNYVPLGDLGCQLLNFLSSYFVDFANWVVVLMTLERFIAVWYPLKVSRIMTRRRVALGYGLLTVALLPSSLCTFWIYEQIDYPGHGIICYQRSSMATLVAVWDKVEFCIYAAVPCILLIILNSLLVSGIRKFSSTQKHALGSKDQQKTRRFAENQLTRMLVSASVTFLVLVIPVGVFYVVRPHWNYRQSEHSKAKFVLTRSIVHLLADLNHAVNFFVYFLSGANFRNTFLRFFCCKSQRARASFNSSQSGKSFNTSNTTTTIADNRKMEERHKL